jgi:hypothetical protein
LKAYRSFFLFSILQSFNSSSLTYDQQILKVLTEAGEYGVSVQAVAKHVYNMNCTFFTQPDYEEIRSYVQQFLLKNSKSNLSLIENTGRRGYYRLNTTGSADARQMMLQFREETVEEKEEEKPQQDLSLDLFNAEC